ncbi:hypothetical protein [Stenotrophomonas acidaminiphila]|uniref:hypothetical protein n=1 Tax=Stenotrophomonas acidaminiphila TaxID=128780 RepID=UPI00289A9574|nr:hypothetical protein [Stenotrophomonas acidaminiphila]
MLRVANKMKSIEMAGVRFLIYCVLAVAFLTTPYFLPKSYVESLIAAMWEGGVPLVSYYANLFVEHGYGDWRGRLICTYFAFLLSPFLVNRAFNFSRYVVCPFVFEIEGRKQRRSWIVVFCFVLVAMCLFAIIRLPGVDILTTRRYENIFGIKSALILVSEIMAVGVILGRGIFEATLVKE